MLRGAAAMLIGALVVSWTGPLLDESFHEHMVPVRMGGIAGEVLLVSPFEVTLAEWQRCVRDKGCRHMPKTSTSAANMPVTGVNWFDVNEYLRWANAHSAGGLRLPTREEWRWLNRELKKPEAPPAFTDPRLAWAADYGKETAVAGPVRARGSFSTTKDGVSDLDGNVWEWTSTCAKPALRGSDPSYCPAYVAGGAHEAAISIFVRNPASGGCATGTPPTHIGFRLAANGVERVN